MYNEILHICVEPKSTHTTVSNLMTFTKFGTNQHFHILLSIISSLWLESKLQNKIIHTAESGSKPPDENIWSKLSTDSNVTFSSLPWSSAPSAQQSKLTNINDALTVSASAFQKVNMSIYTANKHSLYINCHTGEDKLLMKTDISKMSIIPQKAMITD